jgi:hypothetical protein
MQAAAEQSAVGCELCGAWGIPYAGTIQSENVWGRRAVGAGGSG